VPVHLLIQTHAFERRANLSFFFFFERWQALLVHSHRDLSVSHVHHATLTHRQCFSEDTSESYPEHNPVDLVTASGFGRNGALYALHRSVR
jgi:hypothetical protein